MHVSGFYSFLVGIPYFSYDDSSLFLLWSKWSHCSDFSLEDVTLKIFLMIFEMDEDFWSSWNVLQDRNLYVCINIITAYWRHNVVTVACYQLISPINKGLWKQYCLGVWTFSIFLWNWGNTTAVPFIRQESFAGFVCKMKMLDFVVCIFISMVKWKKVETQFI